VVDHALAGGVEGEGDEERVPTAPGEVECLVGPLVGGDREKIGRCADYWDLETFKRQLGVLT
jgi:hypothetical protein